MPRAQMLESMSSQELSEWMAYYQIEPFGAETQYFGPAITSAVIANRFLGKGEKAHKVEEFMPHCEKREQSVEEQLSIAQMFTAGLGGKDLREEQIESQDEAEENS